MVKLKKSIGFGQCAFAVAPGNFFDSHYAAAATVDGPHGVQKEDEKPPQGNELKAPFGELVVTRRRQMPARADCGRTLARSHGHFDNLLVGTEVGVLVDKTSETMAAVCFENDYSDGSGLGVFGLRGRPGLAATPSAEILFGPVETPSRPRHLR